MSRKFKIIGVLGAIVFVVVGLILVQRARAWPALPNSPVPLGELIEKSDLIVHAKVAKVQSPLAPIYSTTNRWVRRVIDLVGAEDRQFVTAHLEIIQTLKGSAGDLVLVDYPVGLTIAPPPGMGTDPNGTSVVAFLYMQRGAYHPVAYSYGTKQLRRKEADAVLRWTAEYVATDKMRSRERDRSRAEWFVKLMENPATRWDGAASWLNGSGKAGEALRRFPADLAKRVEAVAFRDEPLGEGDDLLLRELAAAHPRPVVRRLLRYFRAAARPESDGGLEQPWRCLGAMELLVRIADMPEAFRESLDKGQYPNLSAARARADFIDMYLPDIERRLKEAGLVD